MNSISNDGIKFKKILLDDSIKSIIIMSHNSPDDDAIGSMKTLEDFLINNKKNVELLFQTKVDRKYEVILGKNRVEKISYPKKSYYDLAIILDTSDICMTYYDLYNIASKIIVVDHHKTTNIKYDYYFNYNDCSTGLTLLKLLGDHNITSDMATYIGLTIISDTDSFKNKNVTSESFSALSKLMDLGCDIELVNSLYNKMTMTYINLLSLVLKKIVINNDILYLIITEDDINKSNSNIKECGKIINILKLVEGIDLSMLFIENGNNVIVRFRSNKVNCSKIAQQYGGGGHKHSAATIIFNRDIYDIKDEILNTLSNKDLF